MQNKLISIIVPIYNVDKYLEECLRSIINQTYQNIEIILVDDGSTDSSSNICREFSKIDNRVMYIHQENRGVIVARKTGVQHATGEYIGFIDADDSIDANLIEEWVEILVKCERQGTYVDLLESGYYTGYTKKHKLYGNIPQNVYASADMEFVIDNMIAYDRKKLYGIHPSMCTKLFRRELLREVICDVDDSIFIGEDADCVYRFLLKCDVIVVSDICGYHYRMRNDSVTHSANKRYLQNIDVLYNDLEEVFQHHGQNQSLIKQLEVWMSRLISRSADYMGFDKSEGQISYIFPRVDLLVGKRIVLYGAGSVGGSYHTLFQKTNCCEIVRWVDKCGVGNNETGISSVETIHDVEYDYIVLAVKSKLLVEEITEQLIEMGVDQRKIIWEKPVE